MGISMREMGEKETLVKKFFFKLNNETLVKKFFFKLNNETLV